MRVKTISVTYGRKWNTDNYESATLDTTVWADLAEGESEAEAYVQLWSLVKDQVRIQSLPVLSKRDEKRRKMLADVLEALPKSLQEIAQGFLQSAHNDLAPVPDTPVGHNGGHSG
jgi:hypothetical protein